MNTNALGTANIEIKNIVCLRPWVQCQIMHGKHRNHRQLPYPEFTVFPFTLPEEINVLHKYTGDKLNERKCYITGACIYKSYAMAFTLTRFQRELQSVSLISS